ncbi:MAG: aldo/keto reductase [Methanocorpusculum sp.]|nr:aldo/keto reductase [Methanocorpusculum sp.]
MEYRKLGRTDICASAVGLGGEWLEGKTDTEVKTVIDAACAAGINYIDIFMPQPAVRSAIGNALAGRREKFFIQGHLCTVVEDGQYKRTRDLAAAQASFNDLLTRLNTDHIDVGMIHYVDTEEDYQAVFATEILQYALSLKEKGIITYLGLSSHNPAVALKAIETGLIDVLMFSINPAYDLENTETDIYEQLEFKAFKEETCKLNSLRQDLYAACEARGVGITVMKPLAGGRLLDAAQSPFGHPMTVVQCISYALSRPAVASVLVGCATPDEISAAAAYCTAAPAERDYSAVFAGTPKVNITGHCMYCGHCLPCQAGIDIPMVGKLLDLALAADEIPQTVSEHYHSLNAAADDCIECSQCEPNCPFGVRIPEMMARARRVFRNG